MPSPAGSSGVNSLRAKPCQIEIDVLNRPIGRQAQYAAAFGGINYLRFNADDTVDVEPVVARPEFVRELERWMLLLYTGQQRNANIVLKRQSAGTASRRAVLADMRDLRWRLGHTRRHQRSRLRACRGSRASAQAGGRDAGARNGACVLHGQWNGNDRARSPACVRGGCRPPGSTCHRRSARRGSRRPGGIAEAHYS